MQTFWQDLHYAFRTLTKSPGFTLVVILALALGIGANTAIFSLVNAVLLKPLPYRQPEQVVALFRAPDKGEPSSYWSYPKYTALREQSTVFSHLAAYSQRAYPLTGLDEAARIEVEFVSASYFPLLGVEAIQGRTFSPDEDQTPGARAVAMIGHELWQSRFGGDPQIVGRQITLEKTPLIVVGILPAGFAGQSGAAEVWVPMMMAPTLMFARRLVSPQAHWHKVIGRLKDGVTPAGAQAELGVVASKIASAIPSWPGAPPEAIKAIGLREAYLDPAIKRSLLVLLAAVGFVLLIACVNAANLLLARASARGREIAIRAALGATRGRIMRQLLVESLLLALVGGALGLLIAMWVNDLLAQIKPASNPAFGARDLSTLNFEAAGIDLRVLAFTFGLSLLVGVIFGLIPAWQASRPDLSETLKAGGGSSSLGWGRRGYFASRRLLVVGQVAMAVVLLAGAGLMIRSFASLQAARIGVDSSDVVTIKVDLPRGYNATAFREELLARAGALPGAESVSVGSALPLSGGTIGTTMQIAEREVQSGTDPLVVGVHFVSSDYFRTLHIPLRSGRALTAEDRAGMPRVALINEAAARRHWPGESPLGKRFRLGIGWEKDEYAEIVGVVGDVQYHKIDEVMQPEVYLSHLQPTDEGVPYLIVRTKAEAKGMIGALREQVRGIDRNLPVYEMKTMDEHFGEAHSRTRFSALVLGLFALLALLLAAVGIYGVMSYAVVQRQRELGIRIALGASAADVWRMIIGDGLKLTALGLGLGLVAAYAATRVLQSLLYGVGAHDPWTFVGAAMVLAGVAAAACYLPARRAMKVDPLVALRCD
jgi:putative ABC transport system permease protein